MIFFEGNNKKKQKDRIINLRNSLFFLSWPYKFIILHNPWMKYINIKDVLNFQISLKDNQSKEITFKAKGIEVFVYHYSTKNAPNAKEKKFNGEIANVEVSLNGKPVRNAKFFGDIHRVYRKYAFADFTLPDGENTINLTFKKSNKLAADFFCEIRYYK